MSNQEPSSQLPQHRPGWSGRQAQSLLIVLTLLPGETRCRALSSHFSWDISGTPFSASVNKDYERAI